jgi:PAS domain-containing protein
MLLRCKNKTVYTFSEARQKLATLLEEAVVYGEVRVRRKDGKVFVIVPEEVNGSPLDVEGVDLDITRQEIVGFVHEGRKYK